MVRQWWYFHVLHTHEGKSIILDKFIKTLKAEIYKKNDS